MTASETNLACVRNLATGQTWQAPAHRWLQLKSIVTFESSTTDLVE